MANATNTDLNNIANLEELAAANQGTYQNPILCIQCNEYSFIEGVCNDGCDSDVDLELHTEHYLAGFDSKDCPCSECSAKQLPNAERALKETNDIQAFLAEHECDQICRYELCDKYYGFFSNDWLFNLMLKPKANWKVYEIGEIGSASVVRDLSKNMMSINVSALDAALTADRYGDRPVVKLSEIEYLAMLDRSTLTESYLDVDLIDDFEELDKLNNKQIKSELGVDTSFTQIHFRNANGR